jgi:hypothetical protein
MSLTITNSSYNGVHAGEYLAAGLLSNDTVANGGVTVKANILHKQVLNVVSTAGNLIVDATCDYTPSGTTNMVEKVLTLSDFQINQTICKSTFAQDWLAAEAGFSTHRDIPSTFSKFIIEHFSGKIAASMETMIWQGDQMSGNQFNGFKQLAFSDSDVIDVQSTAITSGNIAEKLAEIVDAIPSTILYSTNMRIYMGSKDLQKYIRSLGGFASGGQGAAGIENKGSLWYNGQQLTVDGVAIFHAPGLPENEIFAAETTNLHYGLSLLSDQQEIKLIDTSETLGDDNIRFVARFSAGVQYAIGSEIVFRRNA